MKLITLSLSLCAVAALAGCAKSHSPADASVAQSLPPARVRVTAVNATETPSVMEVSGTVRPVRRAMIAAKVMGVISELPVAPGQRVKAGDLLLNISAGEISAKVLQAKSMLNQATRDLEREKDLLGKNASTADMVRNLEDRFSMTQAMLREAEVMLGYASIRAPFAGVVARKMANVGDLASPGMPLLEIEGTDGFEVEVGVPDSIASKLSLGVSVSASVPASGVVFEGKVVEISPSSDAYARNVLTKISVPTGIEVRSGQFARIQIYGSPVRTLFAPSSSISLVGQMERIFVVKDGRAVLRLVKTGASRADMIEVLSGLDDGDRVVLNPSAILREGQSLEVQK